MINSRPQAILSGIAAGLAAALISIPVVAILAMGQAHAPPGQEWPVWAVYGIAALLLVVAWVGISVATAPPHRLLAAVASVAASLLVYAGLFAMPTPPIHVAVANQSDRVLRVTLVHEGIELWGAGRSFEVRPGATQTVPGVSILGSGLRVVANDKAGVRMYERAFTWDELRTLEAIITISR